MKKTLLLISMLFFLFSCQEKEENRRTNSGIPEKAAAVPNANFNVYIENSRSMDGYVTTVSDFRNNALRLVTDLNPNRNSINIFYVNDKDTCMQKRKATTVDVQDFFRNLNEKNFQSKCPGNNSTSDLPEIINKTLSGKPNDINILLSDFIFSKKGASSDGDLENAKNFIKMNFRGQLSKRKDFCAVFLKFNSQFDGTYYSEKNGKAFDHITTRRPYYALITGNANMIKEFIEKIDFKKRYEGFEDSCYFTAPFSISPKSKIIMNNIKGKFDIVFPTSKMSIENAMHDENKVFQFSFLTDLHKLSMNKSLLIDSANYDVTKGYKIEKIEEIKTDSTYSHRFTLSTTNLKSEDVFVKLKSVVPKWVSISSNVDDLSPNDSLQQTQTFGLEYLVNGFNEAYEDEYNNNEQFSVKITINRGSDDKGPNFLVWLLALVIILLVVFIILKNKNR